MRKTKVFWVVLTVSRPPLHGRDLRCVQYELLCSNIKDCCCFQALKISSFKKTQNSVCMYLYLSVSPDVWQGWKEWRITGGWCGFVVYPPGENHGMMFPVTPHHLLESSLEPYGAQARCLVHGDSHQLGQAACLIPSTNGYCSLTMPSNHELSNHELSPLLLLFFPHWQNQNQQNLHLAEEH